MTTETENVKSYIASDVPIKSQLPFGNTVINITHVSAATIIQDRSVAAVH